MDFKEHCNLCENIKSNLQEGIICGLTNQKPTFNKTCPKIKLGKKFEKQLGVIHIDIEKLKKQKRLIYTQFFLSIILGSILILSQRNLFVGFDFTYSKYLKLAQSLLVVFLGFGLCSIALNELKKYRKKLKIVKDQKHKIDNILDEYRIEYSCSVEFGKKYHDIQDVVVELKSNSDLLKDSKRDCKLNSV
jgi:hypothetical protein